MTVDASELRSLALDLSDIPAAMAPQVRAVIQKGSLNIKTQMQSEMSSSLHFKGTASSISYDTEIESDGVSAEIGPDKSRHGALANIAYFGTSRGGGGSVPDPQGALDAEAPNVEKHLGDIVERLVRGA